MSDHVEVPLGHGLVALVDAIDAERVLAKAWHAWRKPGRPDIVYAQHTFRYGPGGRKAKTGAIWLHRFILGAEPGQLVDHKHGNPLDCRRENLRLATARQNSQNVTRSKNQKNGGFKGVYWNARAKKWEAKIRAYADEPGRARQQYLGIFDNAADAARAYDAAAIRHFGEFASLNFPQRESAA